MSALVFELLTPDVSSQIHERTPLLGKAKTCRVRVGGGSQDPAEVTFAHQALGGRQARDSPGGRPKVQPGSGFKMNF